MRPDMLQRRVRERQMIVTPDGRLTRSHAAKYLGVAEQTLANWRTIGRGPKSFRLGGRVFYRLTDLQAFVDETMQAQ
jgi:hypothetical protein